MYLKTKRTTKDKVSTMWCDCAISCFTGCWQGCKGTCEGTCSGDCYGSAGPL